MYNRKRKPNWLLYAMVSLIILFVCLCLVIKSEPIKVVVSNNDMDQHLCTKDDTSIGQDKYDATAGAISLPYSYLDQSSLGDAQSNGVVVTDSQQVFEDEITGNKVEEYEYYKYFELSEEDEYLLAKIVQCEAGNQKMESKEAVVMTVLNRVDDVNFPNTIREVIEQKYNGVYQFSPLMPGGSWYYTEPTDEAYEAVHNVQYGITDKYIWLDVLYFESCSDTDNWHSRNLEFVVQYGDIRFYK